MDDRLSIFDDKTRQEARRIKMLLSYGDKLTDENALALSAYSKAHGLDPFNGECFFLVKIDKETGKREELGLHPGIKGIRKKANEKLQEQNRQAYYRVPWEVVDPKTIGLDSEKTSIVVKATLRDSISEGQWLLDVLKLSHAGYTKEEIHGMVGDCPTWIGYGVVKKVELWYIKQSPIQLARKRAEADATRQRFDLPFATETAEEIAPGLVDVIEGDVTIIEPSAQLSPTNGNGKAKRSELEILSELGFDEEPEHGKVAEVFDNPLPLPEPEPDPEQPNNEEHDLHLEAIQAAKDTITLKGTRVGDLDKTRLMLINAEYGRVPFETLTSKQIGILNSVKLLLEEMGAA